MGPLAARADELESVQAAFKLFDSSGEGLISQEDLAEVLKHLNTGLDDGAVCALLGRAEKNESGLIFYDKFVAGFLGRDLCCSQSDPTSDDSGRVINSCVKLAEAATTSSRTASTAIVGKWTATAFLDSLGIGHVIANCISTKFGLSEDAQRQMIFFNALGSIGSLSALQVVLRESGVMDEIGRAIFEGAAALTEGISVPTKLNSLGVPAAALHGVGFGADKLREGGFTAKELKAAGCCAEELKRAGYILKDLKLAGFCADELKSAGCAADLVDFSAKELKDAGRTAKALWEAGFSACEMKTAGFDADALSFAGFATRDMFDAGYTLEDLRLWSAQGVREAALPALGACQAGLPDLRGLHYWCRVISLDEGWRVGEHVIVRLQPSLDRYVYAVGVVKEVQALQAWIEYTKAAGTGRRSESVPPSGWKDLDVSCKRLEWAP